MEENDTKYCEHLISWLMQTIDNKYPMVADHAHRVAELAALLADAVCSCDHGVFSDFNLSEDQRLELKIAALLHDCGKLITPEHLLFKTTKLGSIGNSIYEIDLRIEIIRRDAEITMLKAQLANYNAPAPEPTLNNTFLQTLTQLQKYKTLLHASNNGNEIIPTGLQKQLQKIADHTFQDINGNKHSLLSKTEFSALSVSEGILTTAEQDVIKHHVASTMDMLATLPLPRHLSMIAEIAGAHHEHMDGTGYPQGLLREEMSVQARILGLVNVFDNLTSPQNPNQPRKSLAQALKIMNIMVVEERIDRDLLILFVAEKIDERYAKQFLRPEQIDTVDRTAIIGL